MKKAGSRTEEREAGSVVVEDIFTPPSSRPNPALLSRIRWRCRRGLLELDIVLRRFIDAHYAKLSISERQIFEEFLDMPDNPLWDMISCRCDAATAEQNALLEKIRSV